ncbi:hypothetical protein PR048_030778 [Dryococelus australis]|uniref:Uncharacterized protein n=1 Tax=Dryococelus australis TaxID=614101 RepID=A0ABQ9GDQ5_9NEOP|nr:hypothetical protein PR048_030778 [Dryococelus australis]
MQVPIIVSHVSNQYIMSYSSVKKAREYVLYALRVLYVPRPKCVFFSYIGIMGTPIDDEPEAQRGATEEAGGSTICDSEHRCSEGCDWQAGLLNWMLAIAPRAGVSNSIRIVASQDITRYLLRAQEVGLAAYNEFVENMFKKSNDFQLKTFSNMKQRMKTTRAVDLEGVPRHTTEMMSCECEGLPLTSSNMEPRPASTKLDCTTQPTSVLCEPKPNYTQDEDVHEESIDDNGYVDSVDEVSDQKDDDSLDVPIHITCEFPSTRNVKKAEGVQNARSFAATMRWRRQKMLRILNVGLQTSTDRHASEWLCSAIFTRIELLGSRISNLDFRVSRECGRLCDVKRLVTSHKEQRVAPEVSSGREICDCEHQSSEECDWQAGLLDRMCE